MSFGPLCIVRSGKDCFPLCENGMSILVTSVHVYRIGSVGHGTFSLTEIASRDLLSHNFELKSLGDLSIGANGLRWL